MTAPDLLVTGTVLSPGGLARGWVAITGETISGTGTGEPGPDATGAARRLDVGDAYVLPGAVDAHVHSYSHTGEGLTASTSAAAAGGVTTIVEMPFDGTGPIGTLDRLEAKQEKVDAEAVVDVALLGTLLPDGGWRECEALVRGGVVGFKASLFDTDAFRFPRTSDAELLSVMRAVGESGSTLCVHAENNEIIKALLADDERRASTDPLTHVATRPPVSETLGVLTAMEVAANEGNRLHLCHLSLGRSTQLVRWYQEQGVDVSFETCPHYLVFTQDDMLTQRGRLKINPPLRPAAEQEAMWQALADGVANVVTSDHAPWPAERKDAERILDNASGVPGTETLVAATLGAALDRFGPGPEFVRAVEALTVNPARRYGLDDRKGRIDVGYDADLLVLEPAPAWRIDAGALHSNAGWSPYDGMAPGARVTTTISRGETVWNAENGLTGRPGRGRRLTRS